jgi:ATP-binding cassette subfamily C (CFTR/MRP) protein 4
VSSFSSTLKGLPTIRAYGAQQRFHDSFLTALSINGSWWYAFVTLGRWVGLRLDLVASTTLAAGALLTMALRTSVRPELAGLALTYVLQVGWGWSWARGWGWVGGWVSGRQGRQGR